MNTKQNKLNVHLGIAFDNNYLSPFYALAASIIDNNKNNKITIHAIVSGISSKVKEEITSYLNGFGHEVFFYSIDEKLVAHFTLINKWTQAVYYRLLFPILVPENVERLLYIDTDTLVLNDLAPFFQEPLGDKPVGAVYDNYVINHPEIGVHGEGNYFNSGVLLMDIKRWKQQNITQKAFDYLNQFPEKIKFVDQDALNAVLIDNWKKLPYKYNLLYSYIPQDLPKSQMEDFIKDKVIIHFTLQRPWSCISKNRFRYLYHHYLKNSPAPIKNKYNDWSWNKIIPALQVRFLEFYFDQPVLQKFWRKISN